MKKNWTALLCLMLAALLPFAAFAEEEMDLELSGFVTEIVDGGFLMEDTEMGTVMLNTDDATVWDGFVTAETLEIGQYVIVQYDGRMTRSLPPQAHADRVSSHMLQGVVREVYEDGTFLLEGDPIHGAVIVGSAETLSPVHPSMFVTVYYDGVMALSLPGRANALHIAVPELSGTVSEWTEDGFLLNVENAGQYAVRMDKNTVVGIMEEAVMEDSADTEAEPEILISEEDAPEEAAPAAAETLEWGNGDTVTVYYNGILTKSIPSQLTAMEIVVQR